MWRRHKKLLLENGTQPQKRSVCGGPRGRATACCTLEPQTAAVNESTRHESTRSPPPLYPIHEKNRIRCMETAHIDDRVDATHTHTEKDVARLHR